MRVLTDPAETGAVTLSLPQDIQAHAYDYPSHFFGRQVWKIERRQPDAERIQAAVGLLKEAERPMIIAGGGVHYSDAQEELETFSEKFGIPVGETFAGKSAIRSGSPLLLGGHGVTGAPPFRDDRRPSGPGDLRRHANVRFHHRFQHLVSTPSGEVCPDQRLWP